MRTAHSAAIAAPVPRGSAADTASHASRAAAAIPRNFRSTMPSPSIAPRIIRQFTSDEWWAIPVWARNAWFRSIVPARPPGGSRTASARPGANRIPWIPPRSAAMWSCRPVRLFRWAASISIAARAVSSLRRGVPVSLPAASIRATSRADEAPIPEPTGASLRTRISTPETAGKCRRARERRPIFPPGGNPWVSAAVTAIPKFPEDSLAAPRRYGRTATTLRTAIAAFTVIASPTRRYMG